MIQLMIIILPEVPAAGVRKDLCLLLLGTWQSVHSGIRLWLSQGIYIYNTISNYFVLYSSFAIIMGLPNHEGVTTSVC